MRSQFLFLALALLLSVPNAVHAADKEDVKLQQEIGHSADQFEKLFSERNAKGIAELFTPEAEYVDADGTIFHGRSVIQDEFEAAFQASQPGKLTITIESIRPVAGGVVIEEGFTTWVPNDQGEISRTHYITTHVKQQDGSWRIASVRELKQFTASPHERLKDLAWLIGNWREEVEGTSISTRWNWSDDGNYLISEFSVRQSQNLAWKGTHRIGWDAERKQFRSWIFESSGGTGEGWWSPSDDDSWTVNLTTVNVFGNRSSSTLRYQPAGKDVITLTQTQHVRAGVSMPGSEHRIVRQPPAPNSESSTSTKSK